MAEFPKGSSGFRKKADNEMHRRHFTVNLSDEEAEQLYELCQEWDELMSRVIRKSLKIVFAMSMEERRKAMWKIS